MCVSVCVCIGVRAPQCLCAGRRRTLSLFSASALSKSLTCFLLQVWLAHMLAWGFCCLCLSPCLRKAGRFTSTASGFSLWGSNSGNAACPASYGAVLQSSREIFFCRHNQVMDLETWVKWIFTAILVSPGGELEKRSWEQRWEGYICSHG